MFLRLASLCPLLACALLAQGVSVRFDPGNPSIGPFPANALTLADPAQKTGLRINLPLPDCTAQPTACQDLRNVNQLDGFSLQPRLAVTFSAPINPDTLREGVWIMALDNLTNEEWGLNQPGDFIPINEVIYDPATNTGYARPDNVLDQHRRYALIVTDAVRDRAGAPVGADPAYTTCTTAPTPGDYCAAVLSAVNTAAPAFGPRRIVASSVFTTMSATAWMESARAQLPGTSAASKMVSPRGGLRVADLASLTWHRQTGVNPTRFNDISIPIDSPLLASIGRVAFGTFQSPNFLNSAQAIDIAPTGAGARLPSASNEIAFTVYLPDSPKPAAGYPVVIFGHGLGDSRLGGPTAVAPMLAQSGFATVAISAVGHGYGPQSTIVLVDKSGNQITVPGGGRGVDANDDGTIEAYEGCIALNAGAALRDCLRQTALDLSQFVRVLQAGIDVDGDGTPELDASRLFYGGQSLGSLYGTLFNAIEPNVGAAALNVGGGSVVDIARWSPTYAPLMAAALAMRQPPPSATNLNYVLRYQPAKVSDVPGTIELQNILEIYDWVGMPGDPVAFAPHLRSSTLPGVPIKPVLFQIALGDRTVPNPASSRLIRAANMREATWLYRHDYARAVIPSLGANPHTFLVLFLNPDNIQVPDIPTAAISLSAQQQMAGFYSAGGATIPDPNNVVLRAFFGRDLFEAPALLPEGLNF